MAKRRKHGCPEICNEPKIFIDRNEIMKLTEMAKSWEFTCSFCFKKFPSAQAMGGHQNAHRSERLEEKRHYVRDPIGYRKRAYLRAIKSENSSTIELGLKYETSANLNVVKGPPKILPKPPMILPAAVNGTNNCFFQPCSSKNSGESIRTFVMNLFPPKELSLAESVGIDVKGKACIDYTIGGCGVNLDLTLRL